MERYIKIGQLIDKNDNSWEMNIFDADLFSQAIIFSHKNIHCKNKNITEGDYIQIKCGLCGCKNHKNSKDIVIFEAIHIKPTKLYGKIKKKNGYHTINNLYIANPHTINQYIDNKFIDNKKKKRNNRNRKKYLH